VQISSVVRHFAAPCVIAFIAVGAVASAASASTPAAGSFKFGRHPLFHSEYLTGTGTISFSK
jgi:hypothetical protein